MRAAGLPSPLGGRDLVGLVATGAALSSSTRRSSAAFDSGLTSSSASTTARFGADAQSWARISALRLRTCESYSLEQLTTHFGQITADAVEEIDARDALEVMQEPAPFAHVMKVSGIINAVGQGGAEDIGIRALKRAFGGAQLVGMAQAARHHVPDTDDPPRMLAEPDETVREDVLEHQDAAHGKNVHRHGGDDVLAGVEGAHGRDIGARIGIHEHEVVALARSLHERLEVLDAVFPLVG